MPWPLLIAFEEVNLVENDLLGNKFVLTMHRKSRKRLLGNSMSMPALPSSNFVIPSYCDINR